MANNPSAQLRDTRRQTAWIETVSGPIPSVELGATSSHDHLGINLRDTIRDSFPDRVHHDVVIDASMHDIVERDWLDYPDNLQPASTDVLIEELNAFRAAGGVSIIDPTPIGLGRDAQRLATLAEVTGVNIVIGTAFYVEDAHPKSIAQSPMNELADIFVKELRDGIDSTSIRCGFIGEVGCSWPLTDRERVVLEAAAEAHAQTGASVMVHPGRDQEAPFEVLRLLNSRGMPLDRVIMAHTERTFERSELMSDLARQSCWVSFDLFGQQHPHYPFNPAFRMPTDVERIRFIADLFEAGFAHQILLGQDICAKHRLSSYGGHGYRHLFTSVVPKLRETGFSEQDIRLLLVENPREAFQRSPE